MTDHTEDTETDALAVGLNEPFDQKKWPFYWLVKVNGRYVFNLEQTLKSVELDVPRWRVLMLLEGDDAKSISYLSNEAITKLSTMTRIVQRMQEDGLVLTRPRKSDQRVTYVILTMHVWRARILALQLSYEMYTTAFDGIDSKEVEQLNNLLRKLYKNLSASSRDR